MKYLILSRMNPNHSVYGFLETLSSYLRFSTPAKFMILKNSRS